MRLSRRARLVLSSLLLSAVTVGPALADNVDVDGDTALHKPNIMACSAEQSLFRGLVTVAYVSNKHFTPGDDLTIGADISHGNESGLHPFTSTPTQTVSVPDNWGTTTEFSVPILTDIGASAPAGQYKVTYTVMDEHGYSASSAFEVHVRDADCGTGTDPDPDPDPCIGSVAPEPPAFSESGGTMGDNGWWTTAPAESASSGDASIVYATSEGGAYTSAAPALGEGVTTVWAYATNSCGLSSTKASQEYKVDSGDPGISHTVVKAAPDGTNGWYKTAPTVTFTCTDSVSGIATVGGCTAPVTLGESADAQTVIGTAKDKAGNTNTDSAGPFFVDLSKPELGITGAASGSSFDICGARPSRPSFSPSDAISGLASSSDSWSVPSTASGVGSYLYSATATDNAGWDKTEQRSYSLSYGTAVANVPFLQPINADGTSRFKLGSTIPVKFRAFCGTTPLANVVAKMFVAKGDSVPDPGSDEAISTSAATTGNLFRYEIGRASCRERV